MSFTSCVGVCVCVCASTDCLLSFNGPPKTVCLLRLPPAHQAPEEQIHKYEHSTSSQEDSSSMQKHAFLEGAGRGGSDLEKVGKKNPKDNFMVGRKWRDEAAKQCLQSRGVCNCSPASTAELL